MVFNTGAALLDAIVLAVVSKEEEGTYGYKITRMYGRFWRYPNPHCIRYSEGFRRMNAWRPMTWHMQAGTADTTRSQRKEWHSLIFTELNGRTIQPRLRNCLREA